MTHAAIYARLSRDRDGLSTSIADQLREAEAYCAEHGWAFTVYRDNDIPASEAQATRRRKRPAYAQLLKALEAGAAEAVVCWSTDRLYRHPRDLEDLIELLDGRGVNFVALHSGLVDLSTPNGRAVARIMAAISKAEVENLSERVRRKHESLAREGKSHGGPRAWGYAADHVTVVPDEAALLREAVERILNGAGLRTIVREWNEAGVRTVTGREWEARTLKHMLTAPRIAGLRVHRGEVVGKAAWPPIIDQHTFRRLQAVLTNPDRRMGSPGGKYLLTGLLFCGRCGEALVGHPIAGHRSYACIKRPNRKACGSLRAQALPLEEYVAWRASVHWDDLTAEGTNGERATLPDATDAAAEQLAQVEADLAEIAQRRFVAKDITEVEYQAARSGLVVVQADLENQLQVTAAAVVGPSPVEQLYSMPHSFAELVGTPARMDSVRQFVEGLVERIEVAPVGRGKRTFQPGRVAIMWRATT